MAFLAVAGAALGITSSILGVVGQSKANEITQQAVEDEINLTRFQAQQRKSQVGTERAAAGQTIQAQAAASGVSVNSVSVNQALLANAKARGQEEANIAMSAQSRVNALRMEAYQSGRGARYGAWGGALGALGSGFGLAGTLTRRA